MDVLERLRNLYKQSSEEKTHYYVASCLSEAIKEITKLRFMVEGGVHYIMSKKESNLKPEGINRLDIPTPPPQKSKNDITPRNPIEVAMQIREGVPDKYKCELDKCISDFSYIPPEQFRLCFKRLHMVLLGEIIPERLTEDWHFEVVSIFTTRSISEIREMELERWK